MNTTQTAAETAQQTETSLNEVETAQAALEELKVRLFEDENLVTQAEFYRAKDAIEFAE
jgi:hypothetical protein